MKVKSHNDTKKALLIIIISLNESSEINLSHKANSVFLLTKIHYLLRDRPIEDPRSITIQYSQLFRREHEMYIF